jgi:hypothetical protein
MREVRRRHDEHGEHEATAATGRGHFTSPGKLGGRNSLFERIKSKQLDGDSITVQQLDILLGGYIALTKSTFSQLARQPGFASLCAQGQAQQKKQQKQTKQRFFSCH